MKWLMDKIKKVLSIVSGKEGETLVESLVSLLILSFLTLGIAVTLMLSMRITHISTLEAKSNQDAVNDAILERVNETEDNPIKSANLTLKDNNDLIEVSIPISLYQSSENAFVSFSPPTVDVEEEVEEEEE